MASNEETTAFVVRSKAVDYEAGEVEYRLEPDPRSTPAIRMGPVNLRHTLGDPGVPSMSVGTVVELTPEISRRLKE